MKALQFHDPQLAFSILNLAENIMGWGLIRGGGVWAYSKVRACLAAAKNISRVNFLTVFEAGQYA